MCYLGYLIEYVWRMRECIFLFGIIKEWYAFGTFFVFFKSSYDFNYFLI